MIIIPPRFYPPLDNYRTIYQHLSLTSYLKFPGPQQAFRSFCWRQLRINGMKQHGISSRTWQMLRLFAKQKIDIETPVENSISHPMSLTQTFKIMAAREGAYSRKIMRLGVKVSDFECWCRHLLSVDLWGNHYFFCKMGLILNIKLLAVFTGLSEYIYIYIYLISE